MIIGFDFEIYKRGDYDKVYLRDGKEVRILCDNGKGDCPVVAMFDNDSGRNYTIPRYDKTGGRYIDQQSSLDLMSSVKGREPESWVVVISYMDNKDKRRKMVSPDFFSRNIRGDIYPQGSSRSSALYYVDKLEEDGRFDGPCEKIRVKRDRVYNMGIISLPDDKKAV